jgi:hypothetical protein
MDCLKELGTGMTMTDPAGTTNIKQLIDGFVDDTSQFANLPFGTRDLPALTQSLQSDAQIWEQLLSSSGGKLELSKCFYYVMSWKFTKEGDPVPLTKQELDSQVAHIQITERDAKAPAKIKMKEVDEAHKTLGVWKTITGDESEHYKVLKEKSDKFALLASSSGLTRRQARVAYSMIYCPSMTYSLVATNLSETQLDNIQRLAVDKFLSAIGFNHGFPRAIVYGPLSFGGLNFQHLYTEQCGAKIGALVQHVRAEKKLGTAMTINLNWTQLTSGLLEPVLTTAKPIRYMADNWFLHIREFLITIDGQVFVTNAWTQKLERKQTSW